MKCGRPLHINPLMIQLPITAIVSILHRIAGVFVFLLIPLLLWALQWSLVSPEGFNKVRDHLAAPFGKIMIGILSAGFIFHFLAGIRHLLMDCRIGKSQKEGRCSAYTVLSLFVILVVSLAYWLWRG